MYNVLIIDDEEHVRQAVRFLGKWQLLGVDKVYEADDGEKGFYLMNSVHPDIVILDMKMPIMDGVEFLKLCRDRFFQTKYIILSGYDNFEYTKEAIKSKAFDYLLKPVDGEDLNKIIKRALLELSVDHKKISGSGFKLLASNTGNYSTYNTNTSLEEIKSYLEKSYYIDIKLDYFSGKYFLSKEYILKLFKEKYGFGIHEYIIKMRMQHAKLMLENSKTYVKEISYNIGYKDYNYFCKAFKKHFNMTPAECRSIYFKNDKKTF